jgi:hypothetical protein
MDNPFPGVEIDRAGDWPPVLSVVRDYWLAKRGARAMPGRGDVSPAELKAQLPHILLADVIEDGKDFRYRLVGDQLAKFFPESPAGKLMSEAIAPFGEETVRATLSIYGQVVERRAPLRITGAGAFYGQDPKLFDAYLAPLSNDGATVNMIFGTFVFLWDHEHKFRPLVRTSLRGE